IEIEGATHLLNLEIKGSDEICMSILNGILDHRTNIINMGGSNFKINWYENKYCIECNKTKFDNDEKRIISLIESDYDYYKKEGFLENDIDDILMDV
ncbi:MAG: hypothetical protein AABY22_01360, partial [Nanoarchaeota archaeon]